MELYISKQCHHCEQLLRLFSENKHLIPYFNIMDIESNPYPKSLTSVPTLIKDGQIFMGKALNSIINDVNRYDMEQNGGGQQRSPQQQGMGQQHQQQQPQDEREMQMQQFSQQNKQQQPPQNNSKEEEGDIMGLCESEGCVFESIDKSENNYLNGNYCFLDDGYSESKPEKPKGSSGEKGGRFDNNAYEAMMKSREM
jgi:hypothetical protein